MKKSKSTKKTETSSVNAKKSTSEHRDQETLELFSEILDSSCPRK